PRPRRKVGTFLQGKRLGRHFPGNRDSLGAGEANTQLRCARWRGIHVKNRVEAVLMVSRNGYLDVGEWWRGHNQAAVEVLRVSSVHLEVQRELLLECEFAADFVGAAPGDGRRDVVDRDAPPYLCDRVSVEKAVGVGQREQKGAFHRRAEHDWALAW